jgi:putative membrane protein insertion efficiency factor
MKKALMSIIRFYQKRISPLFGPKCRYYPTCSQYALEALEEWGAFKGTLLTIGRLMRCNIFFPGGVDPVPKKKEKK